MKSKFKGEFSNFRKKIGSGNGLIVLNEIRDENNFYLSQKGTVNFTKGFKKFGDFEEGDILEFEADIRAIAFANPIKIKKIGRKSFEKSKAIAQKFFGINVN